MCLLRTAILFLNALLVEVSPQPTKLTLDILYGKVKSLTQQRSDVSSLMEIGKSVEDRPIYAIKIQKGAPQGATVVVEFGIHARELASTAAGLFLLEQLLTNSACERLIEQIQWYVIPSLNPDGYKYAVETGQLWRKNRAVNPSSDCLGVDLNRNFAVGWENLTAPEYACLQTYCGLSPISQPESIALKNFMDSLANESVKAYIAVHTCATGMFYPYGYKHVRAANYEELEKVAEMMRSSIRKVSGKQYSIGPAYDLGLGGGGVDEWVYDTYKIPLVYTFELDNESRLTTPQCFFPSAKVTKRLVRECFAGIEAVARYLKPDALATEDGAHCSSYVRGGAPTMGLYILTIAGSVAPGLSPSIFN